MSRLPNKNIGEIGGKEPPYIVCVAKLPLMGFNIFVPVSQIGRQGKATQNAIRAEAPGDSLQYRCNFRFGKIGDCRIPDDVIKTSVRQTAA